MGVLSPWHLALVLLVFVLLFGARKLPDAARGLGQSLRILKAEVVKPSGVDAAAGSPAVRPVSTVHLEPTTVPVAQTASPTGGQ